MKKQKIIYYQNFSDDVVKSKNQAYMLPENYEWIVEATYKKITGLLLYRFMVLCSKIYCRLVLQVRVQNAELLDQAKDSGYFLYANHTQAAGDAFLPIWLCKGKHIYVVVSAANLGIPVLGKLLPDIGALPVPQDIKRLGRLRETIRYQIDKKNCVVIYPEAHVWPYYTEIRPFPATSFRYPVECGVPSYCMTTTYQKKRFRKRPGITVYIDGPFLVDGHKPEKWKREHLHDAIMECMKMRSKNSNYCYYHYQKREV